MVRKAETFPLSAAGGLALILIGHLVVDQVHARRGRAQTVDGAGARLATRRTAQYRGEIWRWDRAGRPPNPPSSGSFEPRFHAPGLFLLGAIAALDL